MPNVPEVQLNSTRNRQSMERKNKTDHLFAWELTCKPVTLISQAVEMFINQKLNSSTASLVRSMNVTQNHILLGTTWLTEEAFAQEIIHTSIQYWHSCYPCRHIKLHGKKVVSRLNSCYQNFQTRSIWAFFLQLRQLYGTADSLLGPDYKWTPPFTPWSCQLVRYVQEWQLSQLQWVKSQWWQRPRLHQRFCLSTKLNWTTGDHSTALLLFSNNDSRNSEHNLVRGGRLWDGPLNRVSQCLSDGTAVINGACFFSKLNSGRSP